MYYLGEAFPNYKWGTTPYTYLKKEGWVSFNNFTYYLRKNSEWSETYNGIIMDEFNELSDMGTQKKTFFDRKDYSITYNNSPVNVNKITINETDNYYYYEFPELFNGISEIFVVNDEICYVYGTEYNGYYSL